MDIEIIEIPRITLSWSEWFAWDQFSSSVVGTELSTPKVPDSCGVYEVRLKGSDELLTIGKTSNLQKRIIPGTNKWKDSTLVRQEDSRC